jgi:hypothetical protein
VTGMHDWPFIWFSGLQAEAGYFRCITSKRLLPVVRDVVLTLCFIKLEMLQRKVKPALKTRFNLHVIKH